MQIKGIKRSILLLLIMSILALGSVSLVSVFAYENKDVSAQDVTVTFSGGTGTASNPYKISTKYDIIELQDAVNKGESFSGKYFELTNDIDLYESGFTGIGENPSGDYKMPFSGTFDGNNYTISNVDITVDCSKEESWHFNDFYNGGGKLAPSGFFAFLYAATIENLKLDTVYIRPESFNGGHVAVAIGAIAGFSVGTTNITSCQVSNFAIVNYSVYYGGAGYVYASKAFGGILGYGYNGTNYSGNETIKDCEVCDMSVLFESDTQTTKYTYAEYVGAIAGYMPKGKIVNCVARVNGADSDNGNYFKCQYDNMPSKNNTNQATASAKNSSAIISANTTGSLDYSSKGGDSDETWYYASAYNGGYPTLRVFMTWQDVELAVSPDNGGYFKLNNSVVTSVQIPGDYDCVNATISNSTITVLGQNIYAYPYSNYTFNFIYVGSNKYIAVFTQKETSFTLQFKTATGTEDGDTIKPETALTPTGLIMTEAFNQTLFTVPSRTVVYFSNLGNKLEYSFSTSTADWTVTYTLSSKYLSNEENTTILVNANTTIQPKVERSSIVCYTITLSNATEANGKVSSIAPTVTKNDSEVKQYSWEVAEGTHVDWDYGYKTMTYSFEDINGDAIVAVYSINDEYSFKTYTGEFDVTSNKIVVVIFTLPDNSATVTFKSSEGSTKTSTSSYKVNKGTTISFEYTDEDGIQFKCGSNTITYNPEDETYSYYYFDITDSEGNYYYDYDESTITVNSDITIEVTFVKWYYVSFGAVEHATLSGGKTVQLMEGTQIKVSISTNKKTLKYYRIVNKTEKVYATYTADEYYTLSASSVGIYSNRTLRPTVTFSACIITMENNYTSYATMDITGDDYNTENDGVFIVDYGETVNFKINNLGSGLFEYVYTFSSGEKITYTMLNADYAIQYEFNSSGDRVYQYDGLDNSVGSYTFTFEDGETEKTISPTFGLKQHYVLMD